MYNKLTPLKPSLTNLISFMTELENLYRNYRELDIKVETLQKENEELHKLLDAMNASTLD